MPRVLLVDDNADNRDMLSRRLLRKGFEIVLAVNAEQAYAQAVAARPDLILMDIELIPGPDGWEATRHLKAMPETQHIPVIALTCHAMAEHREKSLEAGCDEFETKPIELDRLLEKIHLLLQGRAQP
jgi:CheY-like chemotaxis protein